MVRSSVFVIGFAFVIPLGAAAHSGGTDILGCHHDRMNGGYHCHSSKSERPSRRTIKALSFSRNATIRGQRLRSSAPEAPADALQSRSRKRTRIFSRRSSRDDVHAQRARNRLQLRERTGRVSTRRESYRSKRLQSPRSARDFRETRELVQVMRVIDGDTFEVRMTDGFPETVRIIGIDAPELVHGGVEPNCYAGEASMKLKRVLARKGVKLEKLPEPEPNRDRYERLLRFVSLNGRDIGTLMLLEGFARTLELQPHRLSVQYKGVEKWARSKEKGLWGACGE